MVWLDALQNGYSTNRGMKRIEITLMLYFLEIFFPNLIMSLQKAPVKYKWMVEHDANPSATAKAYVPYSTAKPKIQSWTPGQK